MTVFNSAVLPNSTHADHEGLEPDIFFEVSEFFDDDVDLQQYVDHDDNKDPSPVSPLSSNFSCPSRYSVWESGSTCLEIHCNS